MHVFVNPVVFSESLRYVKGWPSTLQWLVVLFCSIPLDVPDLGYHFFASVILHACIHAD